MAGKIAWIFFGIASYVQLLPRLPVPFVWKWYRLPARLFPLHLGYLACFLRLKAGKKSNITKLREVTE